MSSKQLCIIDKDTSFIRVLDKMAGAAGWQRRIFTAMPLVEELASMRLDALIVDHQAMGPQGWEFLELVCGFLPDPGVVVCTGESSAKQRVRGLDLGVDDWITKPCHPEEVLARLEAVSRRLARSQVGQDVDALVVGEVEIRPDQYQAFVGGKSVDLTRREFELIHLLSLSGGQVVERGEIYRRAWGYEMAHGDRSVDVYVRKIRKKLSRVSPGWAYIHTHFGVGYRLHAEPVGKGDQASVTAEASEPENSNDRPITSNKVKPSRKATNL